MNATAAQSAARHAQRWPPRLYKPQRTPLLLDAAAHALQSFVNDLPLRLSSVGLEQARITLGLLQRSSYVPTPHIDRAWRFTQAGREMWCIADDLCQRTILGHILQNAPSRNLTPIERSIFGESVCRLLAGDRPVDGLAEEIRSRPGGESWNCDLEIAQPPLEAVRLRFFAAVESRAVARGASTARLGAVPLRMWAVLPGVNVRLGDILRWSAGSYITLRCKPDVLVAGLYIHGRQIGAGRIGSLFGERAIKLTTMLPGRSL